MFLKLKKNKIKSLSFIIYKKIVLYSRNKIFYINLKVPDTLDGRFDLIIFHLFFIHAVLFNKGTLENKIYDEVLNIMYKDFDSNLRELGVGDLSVGKKIYQMSEAVAGRIDAYNKAKNDKDKLRQVILRNIYGSKKNIDKNIISIMIEYFHINVKSINSKKLVEIKENSDIFCDLEKLINN